MKLEIPPHNGEGQGEGISEKRLKSFSVPIAHDLISHELWLHSPARSSRREEGSQ